MAKYFLSNKAVEDLSEIWNYTYRIWSENQADNYYKLILSACSTVSKVPDMGSNYDEISKDIFGYAMGKHLIFYKKLETDSIIIIRILHERMDLRIKIVMS